MRAVRAGGKGLREDLLPEPPPFEERESAATDVILSGFETMVGVMPGAAKLARLITLQRMLASRRQTGMNYLLFAFTADMPDELPLKYELILRGLKLVYTGISARASVAGVLSMLLRLIEEGKDPIKAAERVVAYYNLQVSDPRFNIEELLAALRPSGDDGGDEVAEKARQSASEVSGGSATRALVTLAEAFRAQQEGCVLFLLQLVLPPELLNEHFKVRRTLRVHETMTLELGMVMPLLLDTETAHLVVNTLISLDDIPDKELDEFRSIAALAYSKIRLPDTEGDGAPAVRADFVTRCVLQMVAQNFEASDTALYRRVWAESREPFYSGDGEEGVSSLGTCVRKAASRILLLAAKAEAGKEEAEAWRALATEAVPMWTTRFGTIFPLTFCVCVNRRSRRPRRRGRQGRTRTLLETWSVGGDGIQSHSKSRGATCGNRMARLCREGMAVSRAPLSQEQRCGSATRRRRSTPPRFVEC